MKNSMVSINGKIYSGRNISIINGKVIIDGKDNTPGNDKVISITITGDVESLVVDYCEKITIDGNVTSVKTTSGDVEITGDIGGDVSTVSGDVESNDISGSVKTTSGDVKCGNINGNVSTLSGDIKNKK